MNLSGSYQSENVWSVFIVDKNAMPICAKIVKNVECCLSALHIDKVNVYDI